jgi:PTS system N-acetylglucosamine-specific IIC component
VLADPSLTDDAALKALGARGLVRPSAKTLQVVLGPIADQVAGEIREAAGAAQPSAWGESVAAAPDLPAWEAALGGRSNVSAATACGNRLRLELHSTGPVDQAALRPLGVRAIAAPQPNVLHLLLAPSNVAGVASIADALGATRP